MLCLSFPAMAGHNVIGGAYCDCGTPGCVADYPGECGPGGNRATQQNNAPDDATAEIGILLVALLFWFRLKS